MSVPNLPVLYTNQKSAWMDTKTFKGRFFTNFVPEFEKFLRENKLPRKALFVMENCPAHSGVEEMVSGDIKTTFLSPILQPMDQGVLENLKRSYKRKLLKTLLNAIDEGEDLVQTQTISIKEAVYMLAKAWVR